MVKKFANKPIKRIDRKPWTEEEIETLIKEYKNGKIRSELCEILNRTTGSVANKIRLLVKGGLLYRRRG